MTKTRLQLAPERWYAWQMIPGYFGERSVPYCSPIRVEEVTAKKTGRRILRVSFFNALYAEGVQNFNSDLRILKHEENYLVAELVDERNSPMDRAAIISHIEFAWIQRYCPELWRNNPRERMNEFAQNSVSIYLDRLFLSR